MSDTMYRKRNHDYGSFDRKPKAGRAFLAIWLSFLVFLFWAAQTPIDETIRVEGTIIPDGSVQTVQNRLSGTVTEIHVSINQKVKKDDALFRMEDEDVVANFTNNEISRLAALAKAERLMAEVDRAERVSFSDYVRENGASFVESETELFRSRRMLLDSQLDQMDTMQKELAARLQVMSKKVEVVRRLVAQGYESKFKLLETESEREEVEARLNQAMASRNSVLNEFLTQAAAELAEIKIAEKQAGAREEAYLAKVERTTLTAPVDGTVSAVNVKAVGSIIEAGTVVAEIVPADAPLVILARLPAEDVANVTAGQRAEISVTAFDVARYGSIAGRIQKIAGNSVKPRDGAAYYETYVELVDGRFAGTDTRAPLVAGMEVVVDIVGGKRTIMDYFLTPFSRAASVVFKEN